jgi:hypothetical protein
MDSSARESNNFTRAISLRGFPNRFKNSIVAAALSARAASYRPSLRFLRTPLRFSAAGSKFVSIVHQARMVST